MSEGNIGMKFSLSEKGDNVWVATQEKDQLGEIPVERDQYAVDWSFGPNKVTGYVDSYFDVKLGVRIAGMFLGPITGNLKDGVVLKFDLFSVFGSIKFYLKNGNEVWVHLDEKVKFNGSWEGDYKILVV